MSPSTPKTVSFPLVSYLPFRLIYRLLKIGLILTRIPFWILKAAIPSLRPHQNWTFKQSLLRNFAIHSIDLNSTIGITQTLSLKPGKEGPRWSTIEPFDGTMYIGPLLSTNVRPTTVGGTWYGTDRAPTSPEGLQKVAIHLHGGAFVINDGRTDDTGFICNTLVSSAGFSAVFAPQYRLSGYGGRDPFPAGLQDCLTAYLYLIRTLGIKPDHITISGDSAGGNLAIALLRYLEQFGAHLGVPLPGHVVLISPWVAPYATSSSDYKSWSLYETDILARSFVLWGLETYINQSEYAASGGRDYLNPLGYPFKSSVPIFITWGGREILGLDCSKWADEMKEVEGQGRLEVNIEADAPHDTLLVGELIGWEKSAAAIARKVGQFVDDVQ